MLTNNIWKSDSLTKLDAKIHDYWSKKAVEKGLDPRATTFDWNQKQLEMADILSFMQPYENQNMRILDVGCGTGYTACELVKKDKLWIVHSVDYSKQIVGICNKRKHTLPQKLQDRVYFFGMNAQDLLYTDNSFDVVLGERILINQPTLEKQMKVVSEIHRVLKPNGYYLMFEGSKEGLEKLNDMRELFGLERIGNHWTQFKLEEKTFIPYLKQYFRLQLLKRYGMFYFISRIIHPLMVAPDEPQYDAKINEVAKQIALEIPNYNDIGHLIFLTLQKR